MRVAQAGSRTLLSFWTASKFFWWVSQPKDIDPSAAESVMIADWPVADTARVLSRMVDGIMIRTFAHADVEELALHADIPVINGLTDLQHPCQILADLLTVRQFLGTYEGKKIVWIGETRVLGQRLARIGKLGCS